MDYNPFSAMKGSFGTDGAGSGGLGVAEAPRTKRKRRKWRLDGWPPSGWDGGDDGGGGGGGDDGGEFDPWHGMPRAGTPELAMALALVCICTLFFIFVALCVFFWKSQPTWIPEGQAPPAGLWASTALLVGCSFTLWRALAAHRRQDAAGLRRMLYAGSALGVVFLVCQALLWKELIATHGAEAPGYYAAFFYILTGLHAVHIAGGVFFLGKVLQTVHRAHDRLGPETPLRLVGAYWHVMGAIWIALFAVLYFLP
ncbi:MAG: cytochrome c oxidase subunit 3 [Planctomycetota bacterium]